MLSIAHANARFVSLIFVYGPDIQVRQKSTHLHVLTNEIIQIKVTDWQMHKLDCEPDSSDAAPPAIPQPDKLPHWVN